MSQVERFKEKKKSSKCHLKIHFADLNKNKCIDIYFLVFKIIAASGSFNTL